MLKSPIIMNEEERTPNFYNINEEGPLQNAFIEDEPVSNEEQPIQ